MLLKRAFEQWGALGVELRTDDCNQYSQAAMTKLGAVYEGTLRDHRIRPDGSLRHTMVYGIVPEEWPAIEVRLNARITASIG
ncbi:GNAT family N-acetyltransferase [Sulfobacillus harzensis]|uniref:GNAT family N-acetyltransferase n=1 Tax=Sulfobacillus harzensis TaxID=2729629 RepID=A0A7Y0L092_9FIRM|nr:GNAT family protein [Sulfobacillus harzensis]NMP20901.1 GNAT family N-acetyltransferase [Sulfobacillus harzensis]